MLCMILFQWRLLHLLHIVTQTCEIANSMKHWWGCSVIEWWKATDDHFIQKNILFEKNCWHSYEEFSTNSLTTSTVTDIKTIFQRFKTSELLDSNETMLENLSREKKYSCCWVSYCKEKVLYKLFFLKEFMPDKYSSSDTHEYISNIENWPVVKINEIPHSIERYSID